MKAKKKDEPVVENIGEMMLDFVSSYYSTALG